ncbi:MAG: Sua5/YciO/YrdC/YwlC family protein, partial [Chlamydiia bacterium]|nr:Sua5/YciO/YrdC/YwlC family protein [Chlamydiia bacterium]
AQFLWQKLMPGPLTLILPAAEHVSPVLTAGTGWLGVRQSSHPLAHALVESLAQPITTTSANPSGQPPAYTLSELKKYFSQTQLAYLAETSQEQKNAGLSSTVLKVTADDYSIVREGEIPAEHIQALANEFYKSENKKT